MKDISFVERILIVFDENGDIKAAQQEKLQKLVGDDGKIIMEKQGAAEPLDASELDNYIPARESLIQQVSRLQAELDAIKTTGATG